MDEVKNRFEKLYESLSELSDWQRIRLFLTNAVLLSVCRLLPFIWLLLFFRDLFLRLGHDIQLGQDQPFSNYVLPFGDGVNYWLYLIGGSALMIGIWVGAEMLLDNERHSHRYASKVELPKVQEELRLTNKWDKEAFENFHAEIKGLTLKADQAEANLEKQKIATEAAMGQLARTQTELDQTRHNLTNTQNELARCQKELSATQALKVEADNRARDAENVAYRKTLAFLNDALNELSEAKHQVIARIKETEPKHETDLASVSSAATILTPNGHQAPKTPAEPAPALAQVVEPQTPKQNYV